MNARRSQQYNGFAGDSDILVGELPDWHIESKGTIGAALNRSTLKAWLKQINLDSGKTGATPVILHLANNKPIIAILRYKDFRKWFSVDDFSFSIISDDSVDFHKSIKNKTKLTFALNVINEIVYEIHNYAVMYCVGYEDPEHCVVLMEGDKWLERVLELLIG